MDIMVKLFSIKVLKILKDKYQNVEFEKKSFFNDDLKLCERLSNVYLLS